MTITQEDKSFSEVTGNEIGDNSYIRMFDILVDHDRTTKFLNIFKNYTFNSKITEDVAYFDSYEVGHDEWFDNISTKYYGTPNFWWVIAAFNDILNPFEALSPGDNIKVLHASYLYTLMRDLDAIEEI